MDKDETIIALLNQNADRFLKENEDAIRLLCEKAVQFVFPIRRQYGYDLNKTIFQEEDFLLELMERSIRDFYKERTLYVTGSGSYKIILSPDDDWLNIEICYDLGYLYSPV